MLVTQINPFYLHQAYTYMYILRELKNTRSYVSTRTVYIRGAPERRAIDYIHLNYLKRFVTTDNLSFTLELQSPAITITI